MVPTDTPVSTDVAHLEAAGVLEWWQLVGHFPWGGFIAGGGGVHDECLVRTRMIELFTAVVELSLLGAKMCPRSSGGFGFQRAMMRSWRPFCCGLPGSMSSGRMPRRTTTQTIGTAGRGCWWRTAHRGRCGCAAASQFFEYTCEDRLGLLHTGGGEGFAPEQEAAVVIGDGQRIAVAAVPSLEVPFEVGTPHLVGCSHVAGGVPGCPMARRLHLLGTKLWRRVT
jgi:hypothetical protein